jgi:glycosyltransferase involved in cell wall biosynthesis
VSVVIPLLNEEESLPELASHLESVLSRVAPNNYEVLFIDDGSTDRSYDVIRDIHARNQRFRAVRFRRNYGKSAALAVGFADCKGDIVVTMDADLQDDPNEIPSLITKLDEGYDLVSGWKRKRYDPWHKTVPSKLFNAVTSSMSGIKLHDFNCGLKGYRREVIQTVQVYGEMHRYIPALAHWEGFRVTEIPVQHHARKYGSSKFGMSRFLKGFLDLLTVMFTTRYIKRPLHFFGTVGALFALVGIATDMYLAVEWMLGRTALSNRPLFLFGIALLIVGVQLISLGLLGEMIVKNGLEHQRYSIRERL